MTMLGPAWLSFLIAGMLLLYGGYRLRLAMIPEAKYQELSKRGMMYRLPRRNHVVAGAVFVVLAVWVGMSAFGITWFR